MKTDRLYRSAPSWIFHVLGCLVFLSLPILTGPYDAQHRFSWNDFLARDFLQFILLIGFFYLNYFLLVPKLYFPKNYLLYGLILLIAIVVLMARFGSSVYGGARKLTGLPYMERGKIQPPIEPASEAEINALLDKGNPLLLTGIGFGGIAIIAWLMMAKPF